MAKPLPRFSAFFFASVCFVCAAALFAAGKLSSGTLWKDFRILCVSPPDREEDLLSLLHEAGLHEYVTESNSAFLPVQTITPFIPFLKEAETLRSQWFYDASGAYRIVYISESSVPWNYAKKLIPLFENSGFSWIIERKGAFVVLPCVLLFFFALFVALFCKPFPVVPVVLVFPYLFALAGNSFSSWLAGFFWICGTAAYSASVFPLYRTITKGQLKILSRKAMPVFLPWFVVAVISAVVSGRGVLFMLAVPLGSAAAVIFAGMLKPDFLSCESPVFALKARKRTHPVFKPDLMLVRGNLPHGLPFSRSEKSFSPALSFFAGFLLASAVMISAALWSYGRQSSVFFSEKGKKNRPDVYIPAPEMYTSRSGFSAEACMEAFAMGSALAGYGMAESESGFLFSLSDFAVFQWNIFAYPWRKISQPFEFPHDGTAIQYLDYRETDSRVLAAEKVTVGMFDSDFIMMLFEECASPLEKMLIKQERFSAVKRRRLP